MTKAEYIALEKSRYDELEKLKEKDNFYDYEKGFDEIWRDLGRQYMESEINSRSKTQNRRKKTLIRYGKITISKDNKYIQGRRNGFSISPYMQKLIVYVGHMECYRKCEEFIQHFLPVKSIKVDTSQIYRVTQTVSESLKQEDVTVERILPPIAKTKSLYVEIDGSMISTRADGWKEVKLARLFSSSDCLNPNSTSSYLSQSHYVAHLGNRKDFCKKNRDSD